MSREQNARSRKVYSQDKPSEGTSNDRRMTYGGAAVECPICHGDGEYGDERSEVLHYRGPGLEALDL